MLDIVVYGSRSEDINSLVDIIDNLLVDNNIDYCIHRFTSFDLELDFVVKNDKLLKIYILDIEKLDDDNLKIINLIKQDDPFGIVIFMSNHSKYLNYVLDNKLMVLDFISKKSFYIERLKDDIDMAVDKIFSQRTFVFSYNHVIYRIPYMQINYIEKEPLAKRCIIHTINGSFNIVSSLDKLYLTLGKNFYRVHQSCIVNMNNVSYVDLINNIISFKNDDIIDMISNKAKRELKNSTSKFQIY